MKELKACGAENLPSTDWHRNSSWLQLAALACTLNAWLRHLALHGALAKAEPKALRDRLLGAPARHVLHARGSTIPAWATVPGPPTRTDRPCDKPAPASRRRLRLLVSFTPWVLLT